MTSVLIDQPLMSQPTNQLSNQTENHSTEKPTFYYTNQLAYYLTFNTAETKKSFKLKKKLGEQILWKWPNFPTFLCCEGRGGRTNIRRKRVKYYRLCLY